MKWWPRAAVPCTKVTGRWLFPKAELDHWLASSVTRPAGMTRPEPAPIIGGSHDPLLEWALRESGSGLATLAVGSEAGFARFVAGEAIAAAMHLHALRIPRPTPTLPRCRTQRYAGCRAGRFLPPRAGLPGRARQSAQNPFDRRRRSPSARASPCGRKAPARSCCCWRCCIGQGRARSLAVGQPGLPDRPRHRAGDPRRPCRCRHRHARRRQCGRARFRADRLGAVRPGDAPARLFSAAAAGADPLPALGRDSRRAPASSAATILPAPARCGLRLEHEHQTTKPGRPNCGCTRTARR